MADIQNKFIFTTEGRYSLVSQLGGIKFAVLGAVLVSGLKPFESGDDKVKFVNGKELDKSYKDLTLDDLSLNNGVVLGLNNVFYISEDNQKVTYNDLEEYTQAYKDIKSHTLPVHYIPSAEIKDSNSNIYGTYEFELDKTTLSWDMQKDISFGQICLIGKQYAETNDATFNIAQTQRAVLVGIAQLDGNYDEDTGVFDGGAQLLAEQNEYISTKVKLRFTLDDNDNDITGEIDEEILDISKKLSLVNNGLKTISGVGISIADGSDIIDDFNLNTEGSLATSKTLMVAQTMDADELENEWNGVGLVHLVNRKTNAENPQQSYKPQLILSTLQKPEDNEVEPVTAYNVAIELKGTQEIVNPDDETTITTAPVFKISPKPETDDCAIDIFGLENKIYDGMTHDKMLFSKYNESKWQPAFGLPGDNILIKSNYNKVDGGTNNLIFASDNNNVKNTAYTNTLITSNDNSATDNASRNTIIASDKNKLSGYACSSNVIIGGTDNEVYDSNNIVMINGSGLLASGNMHDQVILGQYNSASDAALIYGIGTGPMDRKNAFEFYPDTGELKLYNTDGQNTITLGGNEGISVDGDMTMNTIKTKTVKTEAVTADKIYANSGFYIPTASNKSAEVNLERNTTDSIEFRMKAKKEQGAAGFRENIFSYRTTDGILRLYEGYDNVEATVETCLHKNYFASKQKLDNGQINNDSMYRWIGVNGTYDSNSDGTITFNPNSLNNNASYGNNAGGSNLVIGKTTFNTDNTSVSANILALDANTEPQVKFITRRPDSLEKIVIMKAEDVSTYHKVSVDVLVNANSTSTGWYVSDIRISGVGKDPLKPRYALMNKLSTIFKTYPVFCFNTHTSTTEHSYNPRLTDGYYMQKGSDAPDNVYIRNVSDFFENYYTAPVKSTLNLADTNCYGDDNYLTTQSILTPPTNILFSTNLRGWDINELEINIFLPQDMSNTSIFGKGFFFNWVPVILGSSNDNIPIVKANIYYSSYDASPSSLYVYYYAANIGPGQTFDAAVNQNAPIRMILEPYLISPGHALHLKSIPMIASNFDVQDPRLNCMNRFTGWFTD